MIDIYIGTFIAQQLFSIKIFQFDAYFTTYSCGLKTKKKIG